MTVNCKMLSLFLQCFSVFRVFSRTWDVLLVFVPFFLTTNFKKVEAGPHYDPSWKKGVKKSDRSQ